MLSKLIFLASYCVISCQCRLWRIACQIALCGGAEPEPGAAAELHQLRASAQLIACIIQNVYNGLQRETMIFFRDRQNNIQMKHSTFIP